MERIIIKTFKILKQIKNRDEYIKLCELSYVNTFLEVIKQNEEVVRILPTEIINSNLENKFLDLRGLTKSDKILIIEGQTNILRESDLGRYYGYFKDTYCDFSKQIKFIIACFSEGNNLRRSIVEENICFKPMIVELKKIDGSKYLSKLRIKFKNQVELNHRDCAILVHLPLFKLPVSEEEYIHEICGYIKEYSCIPEEEKSTIIPAMYLNIHYFIDDEYEQEKLLEAINLLKYCENALDRKIRLAREDEAKKVTENVTKKVTENVTKKVTENVTEKLACNLLRSNQDIEYVHEMTDLPISRIEELKANL